MAKFRFSVLLALALAAVPGCSTPVKAPKLGGLYSAAARDHGPGRNPVIVIPGILGSKLREDGTGRLVWGAFGGSALNPGVPQDARRFALPMRRGAALSALTDSVRSDGALDRLQVRLFGLPVALNTYANILGTLGVGGYVDEGLGKAGAIDYGENHFTCFQFDYDWRRDNAENARRLHAFLLEKRRYVQAEFAKRYGVKNYDVHFDIVAHSMGGLVTQYMLRYGSRDLPARGGRAAVTWEGARHVDKVILVGTPGSGSLFALEQLTTGFKPGPFIPKYPAALIGTLPSVYQLLPTGPRPAARDAATGAPIDLFSADTWERLGWGLADPAQEAVLAQLLPDEPDPAVRRAIALDHLRKCLARAQQFAGAVHAAGPPPPAHLKFHLFAGDAKEVPTTAESSPLAKVRLTDLAPGDGTVARTSALVDQRTAAQATERVRSPVQWASVHFHFSDHLGITKDPAFTDNLLYILLESPR